MTTFSFQSIPGSTRPQTQNLSTHHSWARVYFGQEIKCNSHVAPRRISVNLQINSVLTVILSLQNFKRTARVIGLSILCLSCWCDALRATHAIFFNSLAPVRSSCDFKSVILLIGIFKSSYDNVLRWMPLDLTDDKSTLVQVMAWCRQATSHYLNQCWPRSPTPYGVTRPNEWTHWGVASSILATIISVMACPLFGV